MSAEIILAAAGEGRRMGRWKPGVLFKGEPLLFHALRAALQTPWKVILVGGYSFNSLQSLAAEFMKTHSIDQSRLKILENTDFVRGPATTFIRGIEEARAEWLFFCLADLPFLTAQTYLDLYDARIAPGCRPVYNSVPGHPVLISKQLIPEILQRHDAISRDKNLHELAMRDLVGPLINVAWHDNSVVRDMDSKKDLNTVRDNGT